MWVLAIAMLLLLLVACAPASTEAEAEPTVAPTPMATPPSFVRKESWAQIDPEALDAHREECANLYDEEELVDICVQLRVNEEVDTESSTAQDAQAVEPLDWSVTSVYTPTDMTVDELGGCEGVKEEWRSSCGLNGMMFGTSCTIPEEARDNGCIFCTNCTQISQYRDTCEASVGAP